MENRSTKYHWVLAKYFQNKAFGLNNDWTGTYRRGFSEIIYHFQLAREHNICYQLLSNYSFILNKIKQELLDNLLDDYNLLKLDAPIIEIDEISIWHSFFKEKLHILRRGNLEWPSYKIFLQLSVEHADDSPLSIGAEKWIEDGSCDWIWLRRIQRLAHLQKNPCFAALEGHSDSINGVQLLSNGAILTWSNDHTLKIWDNNTYKCTITLEGHETSVIGALEMMNGKILSWTGNYENSLRIWNQYNGTCLAILKRHNGPIKGALELSNGGLVTWAGKERSIYYEEEEEKERNRNYIVITTHKAAPDEDADTDIRLWDCEKSHCIALLKGHSCAVLGAIELSNGQLLSWSEDWTMRVWNLNNGLCVKILEGHGSEVNGVIEMSNNHLISWSNDWTLRIWDIQQEQPLKTLLGHTYVISGVIILSDDQILSWADITLRLWNSHTGECIRIFEGHLLGVIGTLQLKDGRILSWSYDKTIRLWNKQNGICERILSGITQKIDWAIELTDHNIISYSKDEKYFHIWNINTGECIIKNRLTTWGLSKVIKMPNDEILTLELGDKLIRIWETKNENRLNFFGGHNGAVSGVIAITCERYLSWSVDGSLCLWDSKNGSLLKAITGPKGRVTGALELYDGRIISWTQDELEGLQICVWNQNFEICHKTFGSFMRSWQNYEIYSLSGDRLLSFYKNITTVYDYENFKTAPSWNLCKDISLWDLNTGKCIQKLSSKDIEKEHPEWFHFLTYTLERKIIKNGFLFENTMFYAYILKQGTMFPVAVWNGENDIKVLRLYPDGKAIITQNLGQVCILQLYLGNMPITLEKFEQTISSQV
jgi:WD40 repeat protein